MKDKNIQRKRKMKKKLSVQVAYNKNGMEDRDVK